MRKKKKTPISQPNKQLDWKSLKEKESKIIGGLKKEKVLETKTMLKISNTIKINKTAKQQSYSENNYIKKKTKNCIALAAKPSINSQI